MSDDNDTYTCCHEEIYVCYLGLWRYSAPEANLHRRSDEDYVRLLRRYLEVNGKREGMVARAGRVYAQARLNELLKEAGR